MPLARPVSTGQPPLTEDTLEPWGLRLVQRRDGLRYGLDAILLASFVDLRAGERAVELGAGCGVVSLILARRFPHAGAIVAVELDGEVAAVAGGNARRNAPRRVHVVQGDYTALPLARPVDVVFGNPPFFPLAATVAPSDRRRGLAMREERATLASTVAAAVGMLRHGGRLYLVYPAGRECELRRELGSQGAGPSRILRVRGTAGGALRHVLVAAEIGRAASPVVEELQVLDAAGAYTDAAARVYGFAEAAAMTRGGRRPGVAPRRGPGKVRC